MGRLLETHQALRARRAGGTAGGGGAHGLSRPDGARPPYEAGAPESALAYRSFRVRALAVTHWISPPIQAAPVVHAAHERRTPTGERDRSGPIGAVGDLRYGGVCRARPG